MMRVVALKYIDEQLAGLRWVDPLFHRTGAVEIDDLYTWLDSADNPLLFVGIGIWAMRLVVKHGADGTRSLIGTRGKTEVPEPLAGLPRF